MMPRVTSVNASLSGSSFSEGSQLIGPAAGRLPCWAVKRQGAAGRRDRTATPRREGRFQVKKHRISLVVLGVFMVLAVVQASDMVGVYAVVDKVTLEPSDTAPERIQIWGAFALADEKDGSTYGPAQRGYMYYTCPQGKESICRKEWADLKSVAGKGTGVGFGKRWEKTTGRVRKTDDKASSPDPYPIQMGVVRVETASDRGAATLQVIDRLRQALKAR